MLDRTLTFRDARLEDAAELAEIGRDTFSETFGHLYPPSHLKTYLDETFTRDTMSADLSDPEVEVRIASAARGMIAYCKLGPVKLPVTHIRAPALELHRIYVSSARQGVGVGRILLTWAIERARARAARTLYLGVWKYNERAIAVYASRGFQTDGEYKFRVGETLDEELIMRLDLDAGA